MQPNPKSTTIDLWSHQKSYSI